MTLQHIVSTAAAYHLQTTLPKLRYGQCPIRPVALGCSGCDSRNCRAGHAGLSYEATDPQAVGQQLP